MYVSKQAASGECGARGARKARREGCYLSVTNNKLMLS